MIEGQFYFTAALIGIIIFLMLGIYGHYNAQIAAIISIIVIFAIRMLSILLNWHTFPVLDISKKITLHKEEEK